ncbi:MAG: glycerate kinase [Gemmataceae bacterium]
MSKPTDSTSVLRDHARAIIQAGIEAVRPEPLVFHHISRNVELCEAIEHAARIVVVGGGKAAAGMAAGLEAECSHHLNRVIGLVNIPSALWRPTQKITLHPSRPMGCNEPTEAAAAGVERMLELVSSADSEDIVISLLSGGGSALLPAPASGISLEEKNLVAKLLIASGATIDELNCVRKHLSNIKGGQLAAASRAGSIWSLIISDVIGDRLDVIASGPTAADSTTFSQAMEIVQTNKLETKIPKSVWRRLCDGVAGRIPETPKTLPAHVHNAILANNRTALVAARIEAERLGYLTSQAGQLCGEVTAMARKISMTVRQTPRDYPRCLLYGGETTVRLPVNHGRGGRNQALALALGVELGAEGLRGTVLASAGTDGEDGPTDAAGAIVDEQTWVTSNQKGLKADEYLLRHDSHDFFQQVGGLLQTGLTGTNVADLAVILTQKA